MPNLPMTDHPARGHPDLGLRIFHVREEPTYSEAGKGVVARWTCFEMDECPELFLCIMRFSAVSLDPWKLIDEAGFPQYEDGYGIALTRVRCREFRACAHFTEPEFNYSAIAFLLTSRPESWAILDWF